MQRRLVTKFSRLDPQIPDDSEKIESDLVCRVSLDTPLKDRDDTIREFVEGAGSVANGMGLKAIELIERAVDGRVGDEMVDVVVFGGETLRIFDKGVRTSKGIVDVADMVGI